MIGTVEGGVLGRPLYDAIGIHEIDENVARRIAAAHDLHLLEEHRAALAIHVLALLELAGEAVRPLSAEQCAKAGTAARPVPPHSPAIR